jgi:hypothetical protein
MRHDTVQMYGGNRGIAVRVFNPDRGEWSASSPGRFSPPLRPPTREKFIGTNWIRGPKDDIDAVERKILILLLLGIEP